MKKIIIFASLSIICASAAVAVMPNACTLAPTTKTGDYGTYNYTITINCGAGTGTSRTLYANDTMRLGVSASIETDEATVVRTFIFEENTLLCCTPPFGMAFAGYRIDDTDVIIGNNLLFEMTSESSAMITTRRFPVTHDIVLTAQYVAANSSLGTPQNGCAMSMDLDNRAFTVGCAAGGMTGAAVASSVSPTAYNAPGETKISNDGGDYCYCKITSASNAKYFPVTGYGNSGFSDDEYIGYWQQSYFDSLNTRDFVNKSDVCTFMCALYFAGPGYE